ncbi:MAG: hypothetical protein WC223_13535, partial [Bacteroidales bacterium]
MKMLTIKTLTFALTIISTLFSSKLFSQTYLISDPGTVSTCAGNFYDDGGASGNFATNKKYIKTFCSDDPNKCVVVTFNSYNLFNGSKLVVYDGPDTSWAVKSTIIGTSSTPLVLGSSSVPGGCLTFAFTAGSMPSAGWDATISCTSSCTLPDTISPQDCGGAIPVCQYTFVQNQSWTGYGNLQDQVNGSCLTPETNSVWYKFTVQTSGNLSFLITPSNSLDDYDWALFNLTGSSCSNIGPSKIVSCNSSGNPLGETGMSTAKGGTSDNNGPSSGSPPSNVNPYNRDLSVTAGQTYYLCIENFNGATSQGYTLDFSSSSASIFDNVKPVFNNISETCGTSTITLNFSEKIKCSTVEPADFTLTGPGGPYTITKVFTKNCLKENGSSTFDVTVSPQFSAGGNYTFCLVNTSGSVTDFCNNVADPVCFNFSCPPTPPVVQITGGSICNGSCFTINSSVTGGTPTFTYIWAPGSNSTGTYSVCPTVTTTYTLTLTDGAATSASSSAVVTVYPSPNITAIGGTVCNGSSTPISADGGANYTWSNPLGTGQSKTVSPSANITYFVTGIDANGCTGTASCAVIVNNIISPTVNDIAICNGATATLTASGGNNYTWTPGGLTGSTITVTPTTTTTYFVNATNTFGCTGTVFATVTVNSLPTITATGDMKCLGVIATISGSGAGSGTYLWNNALNTGQIKTVNPTQTTIYNVTGTDANTCTGTASCTVTINPLPTVTATGGTICIGASQIITANGANTYLWNNGPGGSSQTVTPTATATYIVTGTDVNGCTDTASCVVTVKSTLTLTTSGAEICNGVSATIIVSGAGDSGTYTWNNGGVQGSSQIVSPPTTTTYIVTGTDPIIGCTGSNSAVVIVNQNPTVSVANKAVCFGVAATLNATGNGGTPTYTFNWSPATGLNQTTGQTVTASPTITTIYTITIADNEGCTGINTVTVGVSTQIVPVATQQTATCGQSNGMAMVATSGGTPPYTYSWNPGNYNTDIIINIPSGSYTVIVTDTFGCTATT